MQTIPRYLPHLHAHQPSSTHSHRPFPQIIRKARLGAEIVDDRIAIPTRRLSRHTLQHRLELSEILTLARRGVLDEFLPGLGVREASVDDPVEDFIFGLYGDDGTVGAALEEFLSVVLGCCGVRVGFFGQD